MVKMPKSEKIIFLDIDGVLNNKISAAQGVHLQPSKVLKIVDICLATDAKVVITSTWRINKTFWVLKELLWAAGFSYNMHRIIGVTPRNTTDFRGSEIETWLAENTPSKVESYVIIDDDADFFDYQKKFHVQTHWSTGITDKHVKQAIEILGKR